jgi:hypothetical protein
MVRLHIGIRVSYEERLTTKGSIMKIKKLRETTNYTNSTNKIKNLFTFNINRIYIVNSFVLFVVKKMFGKGKQNIKSFDLVVF